MMSNKPKQTLVLTTLQSQKAGRFLFFCCFLAYMFVYLARFNLSAALPSITDAETGILSADKAGLIGTSLMVAYGLGQFINGFIAERFPPFGLIGFSILLSAGANIAMYLAVTVMTPTLPLMCAIWAVNGYSQSFIWPTFMRTLATVLPENQRVSATANMLMSTAFGFVIANAISSLVLGLTGTWQPLFLTAAIVAGGTGLVWLLATSPLTKKAYSYKSVEDVPVVTKEQIKKSDSHALLPLLISSGVFIMLISNVTFPIIKDGIQNWVPTMVKDTFGMEPAFAVAVSTIIPVISIPGATIARLLMQKLLHDEMRTSAVLFGLAAVLLVIVGAFTLSSLWPTLILLALVITLMLGVNTMTVGLIPIRFAKYGKTATVTGILNSVCAAFGGITAWLTGLLKTNFGWQVTLYIMAGLAVVGCISAFIVVPRWMRFKKQ